ncbi:hypothetical protein [Tetragenococcus halophilus]|uniref:DUF1642 domain-containing protein n=1 Tax=Tetragenococcus halophilus (strain DSM 20338 / JCM 20259 / NCIMB 9735 / NBRC 12172) TaxID=945021 RepID=A0AAN1SGS4_TETHN|nr:hypothetical protein [Tetragenococcus halophilus]BAK94169.1 hypothetical protein TEH_08420 [Tetragenococcus halophilus NBRC 12172]GBD70783.1 putative uncharacterized protein [Tetragenococcus halophilus subsp. halophilus]
MEAICCMNKDVFKYSLKKLRERGFIGLNVDLSDIEGNQWGAFGCQTVLKVNNETRTVEIMSELDLMDYANDDEEKELDERLEEIEDDGTEAAETDVRVEFARSSYAPGGVIPSDDGKRRKEFVEGRIEILKESLAEYEKELKELTHLYYLKVDNNEYGYLNLDLDDNTWIFGPKQQNNGFQNRFTKEEITDMNEGLWGIAVPVEEDDLQC